MNQITHLGPSLFCNKADFVFLGIGFSITTGRGVNGEAFIIGNRTPANCFYAIRNSNVCKIFAVAKRTFANTRYAIWNGYVCKSCTPKRIIIYICNTFRYSDTLKICTSVKCSAINTCYAIGDSNTYKIFTTAK